MLGGRRSDHHEAVQARFRQPDLARPSEDLAHVRPSLGGGIASEGFGCRIERHNRIGTPVRHPDNVAIVDINSVCLRPIAGQFPFAPAVRFGVIKTELPRVPFGYPYSALGIGPYPPRALRFRRRLDHSRRSGRFVNLGDVISRERSVIDIALRRCGDPISAGAAGRLPDLDLATPWVETAVDPALPREPIHSITIERAGVQVCIAGGRGKFPDLHLVVSLRIDPSDRVLTAVSKPSGAVRALNNPVRRGLRSELHLPTLTRRGV